MGPTLGEQHQPFYCSDPRTSGSASLLSTLEAIQRWWGPRESVWWGRGVRLSGEKVLMQNCGLAPGGPQILAQTGTWTSCTMWKPCSSWGEAAVALENKEGAESWWDRGGWGPPTPCLSEARLLSLHQTGHGNGNQK